DGYKVSGDLKLHGETRPLTFELKGGKTAEMKGVQKIGFTTDFQVKRSEFGVAKKIGPKMLGDDIWVNISFQGAKRKTEPRPAHYRPRAPPMPSSSARGVSASITSWMCSSRGTPSRSTPT